MKAKVLESNEEKLVIKFSNVTPGFMNALRRYTAYRVPVYAIDSVRFYENSTSMFEEYIAHRLGLIPLTSPDKDVGEVGFALDFEGPGVVESKDLEVVADKGVRVAIEDIPIITTAAGQVLRLEAVARRGIGADHAKFQSAIAYYKLEGNDATFVVETLYHFPPAEALKRALKVLREDLKALLGAVGKG